MIRDDGYEMRQSREASLRSLQKIRFSRRNGIHELASVKCAHFSVALTLKKKKETVFNPGFIVSSLDRQLIKSCIELQIYSEMLDVNAFIGFSPKSYLTQY